MGLISRVSSRTYRCMSSSHFSKKYEKPTTTTKHKELVSDIYNTLIDIEILGVVFERHRKHKTEPILPSTTTTSSSTKTHAASQQNTDTSSSSSITTTITTTQSPPLPDAIEEKFGYDVFGNVTQGKGTLKITCECKCPQCHRSIVATRFAPHLEKCMGMGRAAS